MEKRRKPDGTSQKPEGPGSRARHMHVSAPPRCLANSVCCLLPRHLRKPAPPSSFRNHVLASPPAKLVRWRSLRDDAAQTQPADEMVLQPFLGVIGGRRSRTP